MKIFLNAGCGNQSQSDVIGFDNDNWKEIRFDIDERVNPDIVGTITDMKSVVTGSVDAVYHLKVLNTYIHIRFQLF